MILLSKLKEIYVDNFDLLLKNIFFLISALIILGIIESLLLGYKKSSLYDLFTFKNESAKTDLVYYCLTLFNLVVFISPILSLFIPYLFGKGIRAYLHLNLGNNYFNSIAHFILFLIILDFFNYWQHRFMHKVKLLWIIHSVHHSASDLNLITVYREHPLDHAINSIFTAIPIGLMGYPPVDYFYIYMILAILAHLKHGKIPFKFGLIGKYIFQSPYYHHLHHSTDPRCHNKNYANNFIIWDHVFGTFYDPKVDEKRIEIGLEFYNKKQQPFIKQFMETIYQFYKYIYCKISTK